MTRVSSFTQQAQLLAALQQHQQRIAVAGQQVATGKRGDDYAAFGLDAIRHVNLSNVVARENAFADAAKRAATRLDAQDLHLGQLHDSALALRNAVLGALGAGDARGLGAATEAAFQSLQGVLNAKLGGQPLFGGGITGASPFTPASLVGLVGLASTADAFANGPVIDEAAVGEGQTIATGFTADAVGGPLAEALRQLGALLPLDGPLDATATAALNAVLPAINAAVDASNAVQAENGARAAAVDDAVKSADDRAKSFEKALSELEDVNPAEAITRLQTEQTALQASYQVLAQINRLSLVNFI